MSVYITNVSLDDFLQLQSLLSHAQETCCLEERLRYIGVIQRLNYLKNQYKKRRAQEVEAYLAWYRDQALIRSVLEAQEERYYRQCITAALEQRRIQSVWEHYLNHKNDLNATEEDSLIKDDIKPKTEYSVYRSKQLSELLKQLFEGEQNPDVTFVLQGMSDQSEPHFEVDEVWKCLQSQKNDIDQAQVLLDHPPHSKTQHNCSHENTQESQEQPQENHSHRRPHPQLPQLTRGVSPPLQDHILPLKSVIQELASAPVSAPKEPSSYFEYGLDSPHPNTNKDENQNKRYLPQHIFTEAEPTPTLEHMPTTPLTQASSEYVDLVAAEQKMHKNPAKSDPNVLIAKHALESIQEQLETSAIVSRWKAVLSSNLEFRQQVEGTWLLTAHTAANREFLGVEDELMKLMLKLDTVESHGDDSVRQKRKSLVKNIQSMLDQLDQFKKEQWEINVKN